MSPPGSEPIKARIVVGPIELRGYNHLRLACDHDCVLPDGRELSLPAGALLIMTRPGEGLAQEGGFAVKNERAVDPRDGEA